MEPPGRRGARQAHPRGHETVYEAWGTSHVIFHGESIVLELLTPSVLVLASTMRFLPFSHRWTRADLYFPKHRELLKTLRQVWSYIDFPAAQCHRFSDFRGRKITVEILMFFKKNGKSKF